MTGLPVMLDVALAAPVLPLPHDDQLDRVIAATAKVHRLALISKDTNITDARIVDTLW